ncbi:MAG: cation:proton antiporter [Patescibacteria group bacterium]
MFDELFIEIGLVLIVAAALSLLVYRLRQPLIIAYLIAGLIVGPTIFAYTQSSEFFDAMSEIGVAFLLFTVGLGLNWRIVKSVGGTAVATGVGQVLFTTILGFFLGLMLGYDQVVSFYIASAFALSSTIVVVKLLMDRDEIDSLYGRISVGFLLVQDFLALIFLLGLGALKAGIPMSDILLHSVVKGAILIPIFWLIAKYVVAPVVAYAARSQELLFIFAVAWCFLVASILDFFGFGIEFGALIAGIMLSGTIYEKEINARIRPLRDFFLIIFFIILGTHINISVVGEIFWQMIAYVIFIVVGTPIIVMLIMRLLGYHPRTGFRVGTALAQVSEFSFIIIGAGVMAGHLPTSVLVLTTSIALITIAISSYLIAHNQYLYEKLRFLFRWLEPENLNMKERVKQTKKPKIILFGAHRLGSRLLESIIKLKEPYAVVDFDPHIVSDLTQNGIPVVYGDAGDENFLSELEVHKSKLLVSTIPNITISLAILTFCKHRNYHGTIIVSAHTRLEARQCYQAGATYVIMPTYLGGEKFSEFLEDKHVILDSWRKLGKEAKKHLDLK